MKTCEKCLGTGTERTIVHGIESNGEACIEPIKCDSCDGFGTEKNMKPSELLELCMELTRQGAQCGMQMIGTLYGSSFVINIHTPEDTVFFEHPDNYGSFFFEENQVQDAADWLRKQNEEFRSKQ